MILASPGHLLRKQCQDHPAKLAIRTDGHSLTYAQWHEAADALADSLARNGVAKGSRLAFLGANGPEPAIAYGAACLLECALVLLPADRPEALLASLIERVAPAAVLLGRTSRRRPYPAGYAGLSDACIRRVLAVSCLPAATPPGFRAQCRRESGTTPHVILFTGGTTSIPKGVVYGERKFMLATTLAVESLGIVEADVLVNPYPAHHYGGIQAICQTLMAGASLIQLPIPSPRRLLTAISRHRGTFVVAVPTLWRRVLEYPDQAAYCLSSLRMANAASDKVSAELAEAIRLRTGAVSVQGYGLTETGMVTLVPPAEQVRKGASCGLPDRVSEIRIVAADGTTAAANAVGEVWIRSQHAMDSYFDEPGLTRSAFQDGWFRSGDLGHLDAEGYLYLAGRKKNTISCGAEKIEPEELEAVLSGFPEVDASIVVGLADSDMGQIPAAMVVARPGGVLVAEELLAYSARALGAARRLRYVAFVKSIPLTPLGKPDRIRAAEILQPVRDADGAFMPARRGHAVDQP